MIECDRKPHKSEFKYRILNNILSRFTTNSISSSNGANSSSKKSAKTNTPREPEGDHLQKFSDKRIADLIRDSGNKTPMKKPTINYNSNTPNFSVNESRLREITHTPFPNTSSQGLYCHPSPLIKPVALRPKKPDYDLSHSFRLSTQDQQWTCDPQRNSRFINRRSTIARSEYSPIEPAPTPAPNRQSVGNQIFHQPESSREMSMLMRPRLNLIKMKIHNLIENKPSFEAIQEVKENQLRQQKKFQLNSSHSKNHDINLECLLANLGNKERTNGNNGGSLVSLTSSTSSLLSSSASSLTSVVYADNPIYNKFRADEPKIDLDLIENDS